MTAARATNAEPDSLPRVLPFSKMSSKQRDLLARWGWGVERIGPDGGQPVTWTMLRPDEQKAIRDAWERDQVGERQWQNDLDSRRREWELGDTLASYSTRAEISEAMVEMAREAINFTRNTIQSELSRAINPLTNEIARLKKELAELTAAKPQPTSAGSVDTKETSSFERRLSRHAEHLASLESRIKKIERGT